MAHAVHRMIADVCGPNARELCDELKPAPSGRHLLKYIRNVNFIGKPKKKNPVQNFRLCIFLKTNKQTKQLDTGPQGQPVRFNKDGDAYGSYSFYQYQRHGSKYDYVRIGDWSASWVVCLLYFLFFWVAWSFIAGSCERERERDDPASIRWQCKTLSPPT